VRKNDFRRGGVFPQRRNGHPEEFRSPYHTSREVEVMQEARKYPEFDSGKAEAFAGEFLAALNHGALCLMTSV